MFADDSKPIAEVASYQDVTFVQQDLNCIEAWSKLNKLPLNGIKFYRLHYSKNFVGHEYKLGNASISIVNDQLDLDV